MEIRCEPGRLWRHRFAPLQSKRARRARLLCGGRQNEHFGVATVANYSNHRGYWHGTIVRVQTTDFNMLGAMLPTKLSYALLKGNPKEVQQTLDSNYGLFGMVVTNCTATTQECPGQQILYMTNSEHTWRAELRTVDLISHPYDLLRDPPPTFAEHGFDNSRDLTWEPLGVTNRGKVIGRVYYIRGIPPAFLTTYISWLHQLPSSFISNSGAHRYYALTPSLFLMGGLVFWCFVEWLFFQKWLQKRLAQKENDRMLRELINLRQQLRGKLNQVSILVAERERYAMELATYQQAENERVKELETVIAQMESRLATAEVQTEVTATSFRASTLQLRAEIQRREAMISELEQKIQTQSQMHTNGSENLQTAQQELRAMAELQFQAQQKLDQYENELYRLREELARQNQARHVTVQIWTVASTE